METKKDEYAALVQELNDLTAELDAIKKKIRDLLGKTDKIYQNKVAELKAEFDALFAEIEKKSEELDAFLANVETRRDQESQARELLLERAKAFLEQIETEGR